MLVRVSGEILEQLATDGSEPVVILSVDQQDDGTYEMTLRVPKLLAIGDRLAAAVRDRWGADEDWTCNCDCCAEAKAWLAERSDDA